MIKRPKPGETEEDILRMQEEFLAQKAKNPQLQPAAQIVKIDKRELGNGEITGIINYFSDNVFL